MYNSQPKPLSHESVLQSRCYSGAIMVSQFMRLRGTFNIH